MIFLILLLAPLPVLADGRLSTWLYDVLIDGASIRAALGTRQAGVSVHRKSDDAQGKIVQRSTNSWFLSYSTKPTYFSIDNTGITFIFNISSFDADQQEIANDTFVDLGTRVSGVFYYFVPTVFYEWGDYYSGTYARLGVGLGLGLAKFSGDVALTSTADDEIVTQTQGRTRFKPAAGVMAELSWKHWSLALEAAGPNYQSDEYETNVEDVSLNLGYRLMF